MSTALSQADLRSKLSVIEPFLNAIAIFILATIFLFWDASRVVYVLLSLTALVLVIRYRPQMPRDHRLYSWPIIGFFGASALSVLVNGLPDTGVNSLASRTLLILIAIPLASIFYLSFTGQRNVWLMFTAGCMVMGVQALVDSLLLNESRADGGHNSAAFGFTAAVMTSIVIASYYRFSQLRFGRSIYVLAILLGVCAIILSGTRTAWLVGLVVLVVAAFFYPHRYSFLKRALFALILVVGIVVVSSPFPIVQKRFNQLIEIVTPYVTGEEQSKFTSLSKRVELWKMGWHIGMENKLFGVEHGNVKRAINNYVEQNPRLAGIGSKTHIHNQFMQTFAMSGLVGLFSLLVLISCHFWIFAKYLRKRYSLEVRCFALAGLLLLVAYSIKSIPGVPFHGKQYLVLYGMASAAIWGCLLGALRASEPDIGRLEQE